ncbi:MAG: GGDEF domain-containing protein [Acidobacteria bacterium]|nr:GGDEF domain-containing protein [Acidobacteriota bacterium]
MTPLQQIRDRIERCTTLPSLPAVALRVLELCQQERLDLNEIAKVISSDPALAAKLVRTANSPIFALRREVTTIFYAASLLGISAVRTLVLSFSLNKACRTEKQGGLERYWRRSVLTALAARQICQGPMFGLREEAFLCGLLQDIGMLAMANALGKSYTDMLRKSKGDHDGLIERERANFGGDHSDVGAWLLERWRVPAALASVVGASHDAKQLKSPSEEVQFLAHAVRLASRFADQLAGDPQRASEKLCQELAAWPGDPVKAESINMALLEQGPEVAPLFEIRLEASKMTAALSQAQEIMLALSVRASQELNDIHETLTRLESRTAALLAKAQRDALTGVANRGYTMSYLEEVFRAAVESGKPVGTIFADADHFEKINDTHGHAAGDAVLQSVAQCISRSVRGGDFVGRYGGEEFLIVLRAASLNELAAVAERVRHNIEVTPHPLGSGRTLRATISLGCALIDPLRHQTAQPLTDEADRALYAAKRGGRNRYELAAGSREPQLASV